MKKLSLKISNKLAQNLRGEAVRRKTYPEAIAVWAIKLIFHLDSDTLMFMRDGVLYIMQLDDAAINFSDQTASRLSAKKALNESMLDSNCPVEVTGSFQGMLLKMEAYRLGRKKIAV